MIIVDLSAFFSENGEFTERLALDIEGHDVQILRYDNNNQDMLVKVDNYVSHTDLSGVNDCIMSRL